MSTTQNTISGFVGKVETATKSTRYGMRPVTSISVGVRPKGSKKTSWSHVNIWGLHNVKPGDVVKVDEVKTFGKTRYGKIADLEKRNKRDRGTTETTKEASDEPVQLRLL